MKSILKKIIRLLNTCSILLSNRSAKLKNNRFLNFKMAIRGTNMIDISGCNLERSILSITGSNNAVNLTNMQVSRTTIRVEGDHNELSFAENVKLRKAIIIIRGNNCKIIIQKNTTFGGVRIVNAGNDNLVTIGENCLFADQIEIWASDTHPIFDSSGEIINVERPITIGNKVWVGSRVIILKGVTIQDNSIIGMGSTITNNVPAGVISVGYPNHTIKENVTWKLRYP